MSRRTGFTLFELMIVVTVIALIAAFAIPALMTSLKGGKEAAAISALRTLSTVSEQYSIRYGEYADSLNSLSVAGYVDSVLGAGTKSGYTFLYTSTPTTWRCNANAEAQGVTGDRYFYADDSGVIRVNHSAPASSADPAID